MALVCYIWGMKTIEDIISEFNKFEIESFDHAPMNALSFDDCIKAIKIYSNQKLEWAADNASVKRTDSPPEKQKYMWNNKDDSFYSVKKETILILKEEL